MKKLLLLTLLLHACASTPHMRPDTALSIHVPYVLITEPQLLKRAVHDCKTDENCMDTFVFSDFQEFNQKGD